MAEEREGTEKEKPFPARMDRARLRARVSISDWTEERGRSETSRQVEEREREERVRGLEEVEGWEEEEEARVLRVDRMAESGLRDFLKGRESLSESEVGSARLLRFFLSAILRERERARGAGNGRRDIAEL